MFRKIFAVAGITLVALFAVPAVAQASTYAPSAPEGITVGPGGTVTVPFSGFVPNETVSLTLTGESAASATLAVFRAAVETKALTKEATADGTTAVTVTLPTNASGDYTLVAVGGQSGATGTTVISTAAAMDPDEDDGLAVTGPSTFTAIWIAGGALAMGVALLLIRMMRRNAAASA